MRKHLGGKDGGFTLVELLIVIALIAVLAVALVATLNPIEQINKARDSRYKNDAAELLSAIERYYASTMNYPWGEVTSASGWDAVNTLVGLCGTDCSAGDTGGDLVSTGELKPSFMKKSQFLSTAVAQDKLYVVYDAPNQSVYACFIPKAMTNQQGAVLTDIHNGTAYTAPTADCTTTTWDTLGDACFICVPEVGSVSVGVGTT